MYVKSRLVGKNPNEVKEEEGNRASAFRPGCLEGDIALTDK